MTFGFVMFDGGALIFRKLSETAAEKRRHIFDELIREYGSVESIPLEAWREVLPIESYRVCRLNGMETINSGKYTKNHTPGTYTCICCGTDLFSSYDKYGTLGWLSFSRSIGKDKNIDRVTGSIKGTTELCCKTVSHI